QGSPTPIPESPSPVSTGVPNPSPVKRPRSPAESLTSPAAVTGDQVLHIAVVRSEEAVVRRLVDILLRGGRHLDIFNNLRQSPGHREPVLSRVLPEAVRGGFEVSALPPSPISCQGNGVSFLPVHLILRVFSELRKLTLCVCDGERLCEKRNKDRGFYLHWDEQGTQWKCLQKEKEKNPSLSHIPVVPGRSPPLHLKGYRLLLSSPLPDKCGASVNAQSYSGNSALHSACGRGLVEAVRLLLRNGADSSLKNYHNDTALMVAKNKRVTDVLRGKGGRHLNPKPLEPPPDAPSPHSLSPSPHQHSADGKISGTPAQSPGHAPLRSPLAAGHHVAPPPGWWLPLATPGCSCSSGGRARAPPRPIPPRSCRVSQ
uniref:Uncharacterized protein n=1 Tax=Lepisosteus oculatus TaxID=7918 RepID=W5M9X3_LEPOC